MQRADMPDVSEREPREDRNHGGQKMEQVMKTAHTPGPWKMKPTHDRPEPACSYDIFAASHQCITTVHNWSPEANARLIAAAPELLEALKALLPYAQQEAASLADVDEMKHAATAWKITDRAAQLIKRIEE